MTWFCWSCGKTVEAPLGEVPSCCATATYTPRVTGPLSEHFPPRPDVYGDEEDVVLYMLVHHGGNVTAHAARDGLVAPPTCIAWVPPSSTDSFRTGTRATPAGVRAYQGYFLTLAAHYKSRLVGGKILPTLPSL